MSKLSDRNATNAGASTSSKPVLFWIVCFVALTGLVGCRTLEKAAQRLPDLTAPKVTMFVPARNAEAATLRSLVIVADTAPASQAMASDLEATFTKLRVQERPYYTAIRRAAMPIARDGEAALLTLGRDLQADGVLTVFAGDTQTRSNYRTEQRQVCGVKTNPWPLCPKNTWRQETVSCTKTDVTASARVRLVRLSDGKVMHADSVTGTSSHDRCSDQEGMPRLDEAALRIAALQEAKVKVATALAPSYEQQPLQSMVADRGIPADKRAAFDGALQFAHAKRMDEACRRFDELYLDLKESPALAFNVGFCLESRGEWLRANQAYRRASELLEAPSYVVDRRIKRTDEALRDNPAPMAVATPAPAPAATQAIKPPESGRRVALVIGNARYERSALANPVNDARLVGGRLQRIGFDVTLVENADAGRLASASRDFAVRAKGADMALFYYAGHAIQSEGENYLLPVNNARIRTLEDVRSSGGMQLADITALLDVAAPRVKLLVLDACRDNPLPAATRSLSGSGLAAIKTPPQGMLIAFATSPGRTAEDGQGGNSVFSKHFANEVTVSGQTVEQVFKRVREAVKRETGNHQEPIEVSSLVGEATFVANQP